MTHKSVINQKYRNLHPTFICVAVTSCSIICGSQCFKLCHRHSKSKTDGYVLPTEYICWREDRYSITGIKTIRKLRCLYESWYFPGKKKLLTISPTSYYVIWPNNSLSLSEASMLEAELLNFYSEKEHFTTSLS